MKLSLDRYKKSWKGDMMGGLTAAIIALPMGLAFGVQSGLGPEAGLYTAIFLAFLASMIGGTQVLISDPTGPMTVVATGVIASALSVGEGGAALIVLTFALAGIVQMIFSRLDVAKYVKYIPYPVISGFMGGIGVIIILLQISKMTGTATPKGAWEQLKAIPDQFAHADSGALILSLATVGIIYGLPYITKKIPSILFALVAVTVAAVLMEDQFAVATIGDIGSIPRGLPEPAFHYLEGFEFSMLGDIIGPAITLAALGMIDTLLTSVVADNVTKTKHNGNRELIGQGLGNLVTAFFGGLPGAGSTTGTVINANSGARTNLSGMTKGVVLLIIMLGLGQYVEYIPIPVLAGILLTVGIGIIDIRGIMLMFKVPKGDAAVLALTLLITVFSDLLIAVALGALLSTVMFMNKMAEVVNEQNREGGLEDFMKLHKVPKRLADKVHVKNLDGPMFFGFADDFKQHVKTIENKWALIIDMKRVPFMDETGLLTIEDTIQEMRKRDIDVFITGANDTIYTQMEKIGIPGGLVSENNFFPRFRSCVKFMKLHYYERLEEEEKKAEVEKESSAYH